MTVLRKNRKHCRRFLILALLTALSFMTLCQQLIVLDLDSVFSSPLSEDDLRSLNITLSTLLGELNRVNVTYFMISGTLLGSYRHHGRIPWDDDIDLMLNFSDKKLIYRTLTALEPDYGLFLSVDFDSPNFWKFFPLRHGIPVPYKKYRWPSVDLFFFSENDTHVWNPASSLWPKHLWPRSVILPLTQRPFDGFWVPAPCNVLRALAVEYDLSACVSRTYSHYYGLTIVRLPVAVECSRLADRYPVVVRRTTDSNSSSGQVLTESLVLGNRTLQTITLESSC